MRRYIMTIFISYYIREYIIRNKYCYYTSSCIYTTMYNDNISVIHFHVSLSRETIYNKNIYMSLYKRI